MNRSTIILCESLQNKEVVKFVHDSIRDGYQEFFVEHFEQIFIMLDDAFERLVNSQSSGVDERKLLGTAQYLASSVFRKKDPAFWYNQIYMDYKRHIQPKNDLGQIKEFISGETILDFGCGGGYLTLQLGRNGYKVFGTDVIDYRFDGARHIPFIKMTSPTEIHAKENSVDTVMVQTVLHHIDGKNIPIILKSLRKIASRLLLKEDTFDLPPKVEAQKNRLKQPLLTVFSGLSSENQFQSLALVDYFANAIALGIPEMNLPFEFKSISEWNALLESTGWNMVDVKLTGFENHRMHKSCQAWLVCDRI
jgi:SAM-dependent methyltransferase